MKYIKQRNKTECAPVAIYNALLHYGFSKEYDRKAVLDVIKHTVAYDKTCGTYTEDFDYSLKQWGYNWFHVRKRARTSAKRLFRHIQDGGTAIFVHEYKQGGHCVFLYKIKDKKVLVANGMAPDYTIGQLQVLLEGEFELWLLEPLKKRA